MGNGLTSSGRGTRTRTRRRRAVEKASQKAKKGVSNEGLNPKLEPDGDFAEAP